MKTRKYLSLTILCLMLIILALPLQVARAGETFTASWEEPVDVTLYNPCTGEWVWLSGSMHILYQNSLTRSGQLHWQTRTSYHNVRGAGLTSGKTYVGVGVDQGGGSTIIEPFDQPYHYRAGSQNTMSLIGKGTTENYKVKMSFHLTVTPDFQWHAFFDNFRLECR